jgi:hypothetical protein
LTRFHQCYFSSDRFFDNFEISGGLSVNFECLRSLTPFEKESHVRPTYSKPLGLNEEILMGEELEEKNETILPCG